MTFIRFRHVARAAILLTAVLALGGCGTVNGYMAGGMADYIPAWAGGLPTDAPPRPGTLKYDAYMRERERQRLEPAQTAADQAASGTPVPASAAAAPPRPRKTEYPDLDPLH